VALRCGRRHVSGIEPARQRDRERLAGNGKL